MDADGGEPDGPICADLKAAGGLLAASADYKHSYPHSWRSKAKVIFRCTPQWFVPMNKPLTHISPKTRDEKRWEGEGGAIDPADETLCAALSAREQGARVALLERAPEEQRGGNSASARWSISRRR